jgi:hypothetical protein
VSTSWPEEVLFFLRIGSFINFQFDLFSPSCAIPIDFWDYYQSQMLAPLIFLGVIVLFHFPVFLKERKKQNQSLSAWSNFLSKVIVSLVFIFSNMFTFLTSKVLGPLECYQQPDGTFTMVLSPSERCFSGSWNRNYGTVILYTFLYLALVPFLIILVFIRNRGRKDALFLERFGSLIRPYREHLYFWELIWTLKKAIFVILVKVLAGVSLSDRLFFLICTLMLFIALESYFLPFKTNFLNGLNSLWNITAIFLLLANAFIFDPISTGSTARILTSIMSILLILFAFGVSLFRICTNIVFRRRMEHRETRIQSIANVNSTTENRANDEDIWVSGQVFSSVNTLAKSMIPAQSEVISVNHPEATTENKSTEMMLLYSPSVKEVRSRLRSW